MSAIAQAAEDLRRRRPATSAAPGIGLVWMLVLGAYCLVAWAWGS